MSIPIIPPVDIDLSIKFRKPMEFNVRHQYENPAGDKFTIPENCKKLHNGSNPRLKFDCCSLNQEDIVAFRSQLYSSSEKWYQNDFLSTFITTCDTKNHRGAGEVARVKQVYYKVPKIDGSTVPVCLLMFYEATAMGKSRVANIVKKIYRQKLLVNGSLCDESVDGKFKNPAVKELIKAKKEKMLSLGSGTFEKLSKSQSMEPESEEFLAFEQESVENEDLDDYEPEEIQDTCGICNQEIESFFPLFEIVEGENFSFAEMVGYCFSLNFEESRVKSNKICENCVKRVKDACFLKTEIEGLLKNDKEMDESLLKEVYVEEYLMPPEDSSETFIDDLDFEEDPEYYEEYVEQDTPDVTVSEQENDSIYRRSRPDTNVRPKRCYLCDIDFEGSPEDHFRTTHNNFKLQRCEKCIFQTEFPWFMNLHYQLHEIEFKECPKCGKKYPFTASNKFAVHKSRCGKPNHLIYKTILSCKFGCDYKTYRRNEMRTHERKSHTNERPFACSECGDKFFTKIALRRHQMKHGIGASCSCLKCGKKFLQNYERVRHQANCNAHDSIQDSDSEYLIIKNN